MAWLWETFEEFEKYVQPIEYNRPAIYKVCLSNSWFENHAQLNESFLRFVEKTQELISKKSIKHSESDREEKILSEMETLIWNINREGEVLLLYNKRLAMSHWASDFIHEKDISEHWERYCGEKRIYHELDKYISATENLITGYNQFVKDDSNFLLDDLSFPPELKKDFILSRNLFSVGFDEIGLLIAGRALEGVLRRIIQEKQVKITSKNRSTPGWESDFYDLIELSYRVMWKSPLTRLIDNKTRQLLHFLRNLRNSSAHPSSHQPFQKSAREAATMVVEIANYLWSSVSDFKGPVKKVQINKDW